MGKVFAPILKLFFIYLYLPLLVLSSSNTQGHSADIDHWFRNLRLSETKLTRLHFYFQDQNIGPDATAVTIVPPQKTSSTAFGKVNICYDPLTEGPEQTSKIVGRAQGLYVYSSYEEFSVFMGVTYILTSGEHNGSSFTISGRNPVTRNPRELTIIGGTGKFRLARGFAMARNYIANATFATVELDVAILHY